MTPATSAAQHPGDSWERATDAPLAYRWQPEPPPAATTRSPHFDELRRTTAESWQKPSDRKPGASAAARSLQFVVPGVPFAKQRPRVTRAGHAYTPQATMRYEAMVKVIAAEALAEHGFDPFAGPVELRVEAYFPIPKSWSKRKREEAHWHVSKPDGDNLGKAIADAGNGVLWADDSAVAKMTIEKRYDPIARTVVWVHAL